MSGAWKAFWDNYRPREPENDGDLFFQVGKTVNREPIPHYVFRRLLDRLVAQLDLSLADHLLDLCCGNGLVSYDLAAHVGRLTGIDFAENLIRAAQKLKSRDNVAYYVGDVTAPLSSLFGEGVCPNKILMNDALAYFEPADLDCILGNLLHHARGRSFNFLLTDIPNADLKWNFYNTPERASRHRENMKRPGNINDGLGRWWQPQEVESVCRKREVMVQITNQSHELSAYRMDALIVSKGGS